MLYDIKKGRLNNTLHDDIIYELIIKPGEASTASRVAGFILHPRLTHETSDTTIAALEDSLLPTFSIEGKIVASRETVLGKFYV